MNSYEVRAVKRQLESYQDLLAMAAEKDREVLVLQAKYENLATPTAIRYDHESGGSGKDKDSIYVEIFSEQMEAEKKAAQYRLQAAQIERFIESVEDEASPVLVKAYIEGKRYWEIGQEIGYTKAGVHRIIQRFLEQTPARIAETNGLL